MNTHMLNLLCVEMTEESRIIDAGMTCAALLETRRVVFETGDARLSFTVNGRDRFQPGKTYIISIDEA